MLRGRENAFIKAVAIAIKSLNNSQIMLLKIYISYVIVRNARQLGSGG